MPDGTTHLITVELTDREIELGCELLIARKYDLLPEEEKKKLRIIRAVTEIGPRAGLFGVTHSDRWVVVLRRTS